MSTAKAEYDVAQSDLGAARKRLNEIQVRLAEARRNRDRNRSLVANKLVSQSALDASEAEVGAFEARLDAERANVKVAESSLALRQQALNDHEIRAPFTGVVISKDAQPGEMVSPMSAGGGYTRTGVATIVDMDSREIEVDVNEAYVNRVHPAQRVQAVLDAYPDWQIPAHVIGIVPTADRQKATVKVRIAFDGLDPRILPDMGVKVSFFDPEGMTKGTTEIQVPEKAIVRKGDTARVWVVVDNKASPRDVQTGETRNGEVAVVSGLKGGEVVIVDPPKRLRDGAAVKLKGA
jgi:RND family efflux transporter MFP subunit